MHRILPLDRINSSVTADWSLNATEVEMRRIQYGSNDIVEVRSSRWIELAKETIKDPMIWFLIVASILFAIVKNYNQTIILLLATIPLIGLDAFLHWRTQASTRSLSTRLAGHAVVIRNGIENEIPAAEIVPGDLVVVSASQFFPADGIIIVGKNLQVDESALTGEAFPVQKKNLTAIPAYVTEPKIDEGYWGFAGTRLLTGRALLRVIYTGRETLYGEIVNSALRGVHARTPLQIAVSKLVFLLIAIVSLLCLILAVVRYYQGFGLIDAILSAAILAVAALPDEFPIVFSFFLGVGVYRLARKKALVRRAVSVENIGRVTCICSDKTGTITEGHFQLSDCYPAENFDKQQILILAMLASRTESNDPLDLAIAEKVSEQKIKIPERLQTFPFTEDRQRETAIARKNSQFLAATKGAPEKIFSISNLSEADKKIWLQRVIELASSGYKVIACAQYLSDEKIIAEPQTNYQFAGLLIFSDPPRQGVSEAVQLCRQSHIHVLMITGDHPETARSVASEIGLGDGNPKVILAKDVAEHLQADGDYFRGIDVIARAIPSQKLLIVNALQSAGEIVAVTGDGVNDVPALKAADIGIAMGERGTQSAREVASIVLLDDNFDSIVNAIAEGRQLFKNLQLSFKYLIIFHIPFVISAAIIPLLGFPLLYFPIHVVWIELLIHPTAMLVFQDLPPTKKLAPIVRRYKIHFFSKRHWLGILLTGLFTTVLVISSYILLIHEGHAVEQARALALGMLGFISASCTAALSRLRNWISRIITFTTIITTILLIQIPLTAKFLLLAPLNLRDWLLIIVVAIGTWFLASI